VGSRSAGGKRSSEEREARAEPVGEVPWRRGLKVVRVDCRPGRGPRVSPGVCGLLSLFASLKLLVSPSRSSSASSRMTPRTRRTMFPTAISRGWAAVNLWPTCCTRSINLPTSVILKVATTRRMRCAVAMAHGLELRIWRLLSRLCLSAI